MGRSEARAQAPDGLIPQPGVDRGAPRAAVVVLRPMRESDIDAILLIERAVYEFPWSETIFRGCLRAGYCSWVMCSRTGLEAYGVMQVAAGESHVLNLCVRGGSQRRGLGGRLLARLLEVARDHGADTALLEVRPTNAGALVLYARLGFHEVGMRRAYYPGRNGREDAIILAKALI